jgi:hypothetical protein
MRKNELYIKITYILKLLLNVVISGTEALIVWGSKFLYVFAACELSHVLTPSISSLLLMKRCDPNHLFM